MCRLFLWATVIAIVLAVPPCSFAQETPDSNGPPAVRGNNGSDVVRLRSGAVYRGLIEEYDPASHVVIVLVSGEKRRFEIADVLEAGPFQVAPLPRTQEPPAFFAPTAPGEVARARGRVQTRGTYQLQLEAPAHYSFFLIEGRAQRRLCTGSCATRLVRGFYTVGLGRDGGDLLKARKEISVSGPLVVEARVKSRRATRIVGGVMLGATPISLGMFFGGILLKQAAETAAGKCLNEECKSAEADSKTRGITLIALGAIATVALAVGGIAALTRKDDVMISTSAGFEKGEGADLSGELDLEPRDAVAAKHLMLAEAAQADAVVIP